MIGDRIWQKRARMNQRRKEKEKQKENKVERVSVCVCASECVCVCVCECVWEWAWAGLYENRERGRVCDCMCESGSEEGWEIRKRERGREGEGEQGGAIWNSSWRKVSFMTPMRGSIKFDIFLFRETSAALKWDFLWRFKSRLFVKSWQKQLLKPEKRDFELVASFRAF